MPKSTSLKFRSKFEKGVYGAIPRGQKRRVEYEPESPAIHYTLPKRYIPDFKIGKGVYVECKGYFKAGDRTKMLRVKRENPGLDIRFVFQRANNRLTKSKNSMMYWQWAEKHGFPWAEGTIPKEWYD